MDSSRDNGSSAGINVRADTWDAGIDQTLGLSLNGKFGVDPTKEGSLIGRCSSASPFLTICGLGGGCSHFIMPRMYSLLRDARAENCRRNRLEARKRRFYKAMSVRARKDKADNFGQARGKRIVQGRAPPAQAQRKRKNEPKPPKADNAAADKKAAEAKSVTVAMPSVTTIGKGPNGRKVEGLLYNYGRPEEVMIICSCDGRLMPPAEFVKHAGGNEVEYPLQHITVNYGVKGSD